MDSSRRAVESYWRSRMIDGATSDEDKVTPVYKLEEIAELLRSSHAAIVKEISEFVLKRLEHKSPIVKQKALRLIKYVVGKSGVEFRREMQRHSVAIRQLTHYKGQLDPLKGDSLNKAVRDAANETVAVIFSSDDNKPAPSEDLNRRIQGFGNTNFEMAPEVPKSFLSEVVGIGSATIKQGLSNFTQSPSIKKNDTGSYRSPNLRRSLTTENESEDRYERAEHHNEAHSSSRFSKNATSGPWGNNHPSEETNTGSSSNDAENKTREERLLETIVTSGGVRLQPTREALQVFLMEATKLDALALSHALESKLLSPMWQVRMKAVCVLEAILRKKDVEQFFIMESYFVENIENIVKCTESPQASLREKSMKVLNLLVGEQNGSVKSHLEKPIKSEKATFQVPDLIDTNGPEDYNITKDFAKPQSAQPVVNPNSFTRPIIDDLFSDGLGTGPSPSEHKHDDDPFADVSFHTNKNKEHIADIFFGSSVDHPEANVVSSAANENGPELFDIFGTNSLQQMDNHSEHVNHVMAGLSINEGFSTTTQNGNSSLAFTENILGPTNKPSQQAPEKALNGVLGSQPTGVNGNAMIPMGPMAYNMPPSFMFNPAFASQQLNYGDISSILAQQQQLLATMSNFQQMGNLQSQSSGANLSAGNMGGLSSSPLPDIFNPILPNQTPTSLVNNSKKEDTKAFDFISDHLAAARDPKRLV